MSTLNVGAIEHPTPGSAVSLNGTVPSNRNRIINGDMRIDQRNAGASVTPTTADVYTLDRWVAFRGASSKYSVQQNAGSITPPTGFTNYIGFTSLSAYTVGASEVFGLGHRIEGFNSADLMWGTASAQSATLSFWVRSSLTGTFGGSLQNSASNRSYPFSYSINAANTWEYKTITIPGDTSGTWLTNNGMGIQLTFSIGIGSTVSGTAGAWAGANYFSSTGATSVVGTNGATFYITGVQLEAGSVATPFERRQYGQELALCQRYYQQIKGGIAMATSSSNIAGILKYTVIMRSAPTLGKTSTNIKFGDAISVGSVTTNTPTYRPDDFLSREISGSYDLNGFSGFTARHNYFHEPTATNPGLFSLDAEL